MEIFKKKNRGELFGAMVLGFLASFPVAGFLGGFFSGTSNGGSFAELKARFFVGLFAAVASATSWGKPWGDDVSDIKKYSFGLLLVVVFIMLSYLIFKLIKRVNRKEPIEL